MKYRLPRQLLSDEIASIIIREIKRQKMKVDKASAQDVKELAKVCAEIESNGLPDYLVCKKLSKELGSGIFLHPNAKPIEKGEVIAAYAGETSLVPQNRPDDASYAFAPISDLLLTQEEQKKYDPKAKYHPKRLYSLKLDALKKGNFARFINHSEKPNVVAFMMALPKNTLGLEPMPVEIIYCAKKTIRPGEQLMVSYEDGEKSYWGVAKIKPIVVLPNSYTLDASLKLIHPKAKK